MKMPLSLDGLSWTIRQRCTGQIKDRHGPFWHLTVKLQRLMLDISKKASITLFPISTDALHSSTVFFLPMPFHWQNATKISETGGRSAKGFGQDNMGNCLSSQNSITICCFHYSGETVQRFNAEQQHGDCSVR